MLVTFLNRQLFWIVSVNLKNTNTEGKRDHTLNLPGKKSTYQTTETSSGSSESILALSVSAAVEQAGADGSACVLAGFGVLDSVWLDALLILISLYHTEEHDTETETVRDSQHSCNQTKCCVLYHRANHHLMMQPLLTGDSAVSFSDRELQDLLSCQEPTLGSLPVSELFLLATTGPGPDPRLSRLILGPADSEGTFSPPGPSGSLPESLLVRLPFRLSEEETWLIWPSRSSREDRGTFTEVFLHFLSFFVVVFFSIQFNSKSNW